MIDIYRRDQAADLRDALKELVHRIKHVAFFLVPVLPPFRAISCRPARSDSLARSRHLAVE